MVQDVNPASFPFFHLSLRGHSPPVHEVPPPATSGAQYSINAFKVALSIAQIFASMFYAIRLSRTYLTALALGNPPLILRSIFSDAFRPVPLPQQKVFSLMVSSGISWKWLHTFRRTYLGSSRIPIPLAVLHESCHVTLRWLFPARVKLQLPILIRSAVNSAI